MSGGVAAPAFVLCSELGGSTFRGTDLLALVGNQSVSHCLSIVERSSLFQIVPLGDSIVSVLTLCYSLRQTGYPH